ncbi:hypothetical protein DD876_10780, partial [Staphylococcus pseudintermedius]
RMIPSKMSKRLNKFTQTPPFSRISFCMLINLYDYMDKNKNHTSSIVRFEQRKIKVSVVITNKKR